MRTEHLKHVGWEPYQVVSYVNWRVHAQEIIPFPLPDGGCQFVVRAGAGGGALIGRTIRDPQEQASQTCVSSLPPSRSPQRSCSATKATKALSTSGMGRED